mgnify:CR=1 FL=1
MEQDGLGENFDIQEGIFLYVRRYFPLLFISKKNRYGCISRFLFRFMIPERYYLDFLSFYKVYPRLLYPFHFYFLVSFLFVAKLLLVFALFIYVFLWKQGKFSIKCSQKYRTAIFKIFKFRWVILYNK